MFGDNSNLTLVCVGRISQKNNLRRSQRKLPSGVLNVGAARSLGAHSSSAREKVFPRAPTWLCVEIDPCGGVELGVKH